MKVGFTCSTFDLLHAGHIQMLREAKEQCDYLICGLQIINQISNICNSQKLKIYLGKLDFIALILISKYLLCLLIQ